jgi:hypothetical protein
VSDLPSFEYLFGCSNSSLQTIELAALDAFAQRLKAAKLEMAEAATQWGNAGTVRWLLNNREKLIEAVRQNAGADPQTILAQFSIPEPKPEEYQGQHAKPRWA